MSWNYRIVKHDEADEVYFQIHEVYYDEKNDIEAYTEDTVHPCGETKEELISDLKNMLHDAEKYPVLSVITLEEKFAAKKKINRKTFPNSLGRPHKSKI